MDTSPGVWAERRRDRGYVRSASLAGDGGYGETASRRRLFAISTEREDLFLVALAEEEAVHGSTFESAKRLSGGDESGFCFSAIC